MKEKNGEHPFGDAGQLILFGVFLIVWAGDSFFLHKSIFLSGYIPLYIRIIILGLAFGIAIYFFSSGHIVVSGEQRPDKVLETGAFGHIRHPLYLASMVTYLGLAISTMSLFSFAVFIVIFAFHNYIANYEEKLLEIKFGDAYEQYKLRTGKWLPKIRL